MGRKIVKQAGIILFWLAVWFLLALAVNNKILMVTPLQTLRELLTLLTDGRFYRVVAGSLLRIAAGFVTGFAAAVLLAALSKRFRIVEELLAPLMSLMKAIPVASFVVLLLIWWGSSFLAVAVCFLVVLPNIYISTLEGLKNVDRNMTEMAWVFRLSGRDCFFYIYCPALRPFLTSSMSIALGMSWKSGVAAEIIGTPASSIGEQIYLSKLYLNTAAVFAWTAVVILLSFLFEKGVLWLTERFFSWQPPCRGPVRRAEGGEVALEGVSKRYGDRQVLEWFNAEYLPGRTYYLTSPSGSGKTTLLRLIAGLTEPDAGEIRRTGECSVLFQEDRLCETCSAVKNVELVTGDAAAARRALRQVLGDEELDRPCAELSGGMKRRVALVRAMEARAGIVLLDEPYTGMDAGTRERAEAYIRLSQRERAIVIATHI